MKYPKEWPGVALKGNGEIREIVETHGGYSVSTRCLNYCPHCVNEDWGLNYVDGLFPLTPMAEEMLAIARGE